MKQLSFLMLLFFCSVPALLFAQQNAPVNYDISKPINGLEPNGFNKVVCLKNGNTLLLHMEKDKPVLVKLFDTAHKQIASRKYTCSKLDIALLHDAMFKGIFDVNNEAVLFIAQEQLSKHRLIRLRFSGKDGKLIEEKEMAHSPGISKVTGFFVMKDKATDGYAILTCVDAPQFYTCDIQVAYYNSMHEQIKAVPLEVDRKKYDYLSVIDAELQPNGICVVLGLSKLKLNGHPTASLRGVGTLSTEDAAAVYNHYTQFFYLPATGDAVKTRIVDVSTEVFPYYANYTYNPFMQSLNIMMLSYREALLRYGLMLQPVALKQQLFFTLEADGMQPKYADMRNTMANTYLKSKTGTASSFDGIPVKTFTNENGVSTTVSQAFNRYDNIETHKRSRVYESFFGNIGITQYDESGNEIWGTVLPLSQYYKSYQRYYNAADLSKRWQQQMMFEDWPPEVFERQFLSLNTYSYNKDLFIIYNDDDNNFNRSLEGKHIDTTYTFANTNACYYKVDNKKEVSKHYLFGAPNRKEYKSSLVEGADFDEQRGVYVSLIQYKRNESVSMRMAWAKL